MPSITLTLPVFITRIREGKKFRFTARPVFYPKWAVRQKTRTKAIKALERDLGKNFESKGPDFADVNHYWCFTHPKKARLYRLTIPIKTNKSRTQNLETDLVLFKFKGHGIVLLPDFENHLLHFPGDHFDEDNLRELTRPFINDFISKHLKKEKPEQIFAKYAAPEYRELSTIKVEYSTSLWEDFYNPPGSPDNGFLRAFFAKIRRKRHDLYSECINNKAPSEYRRALHREKEVELVYNNLFGPFPAHTVLIGPPGVGKHAILEEVIYRYTSNHSDGQSEAKMHSKKTPHPRKRKVHLFTPHLLISGQSVIGEWQERMHDYLNTIAHPEGDSKQSDILMVDMPVQLINTGNSNGIMNLSLVLQKWLEKKQFPMVILATRQEWETMMLRNRSFARMFQRINVEPVGEVAAKEIVLSQKAFLEELHDCTFQIEAIDEAFKLHRRFFPKQCLPGSVLKLLETLGEQKGGDISGETLKSWFFKNTGLSESFFDESEPLPADKIEAELRRNLIGQPQAVEVLVNVISLIRAKLNEPGKPLATLLFIGNTGVGKTEAAKILCEYLTGSASHLIRLDMNEFSEYNSVQRLIGFRDQPSGALTQPVKIRKSGVLLLDEIEKAHRSVHNLLLQVLDDARLTDYGGHTVDFSNMVIVLTTNVGAERASRLIGIGQKEVGENFFIKELSKKFPPEFINRIDHKVVFNRLKKEEIQEIARLQIQAFKKREGFRNRAVFLDIPAEAIALLSEMGHDPALGGRALKRAIEKNLTAVLANHLIKYAPDRPLVIQLNAEGGAIEPKITPLSYIRPLEGDPLPHPKKADHSHWLELDAFLENLLNEWETDDPPKTIEVKDSSSLEETSLYYSMSELIRSMREQIRAMFPAENVGQIHIPANKIRLRHVSTKIGFKNSHLLGRKLKTVLLDRAS
ncbi:MAG: ATP-dependent Clp protease ATP-binding subunit, partial [Bacteroidetes bacterium]